MSLALDQNGNSVIGLPDTPPSKKSLFCLYLNICKQFDRSMGHMQWERVWPWEQQVWPSAPMQAPISNPAPPPASSRASGQPSRGCQYNHTDLSCSLLLHHGKSSGFHKSGSRLFLPHSNTPRDQTQTLAKQQE